MSEYRYNINFPWETLDEWQKDYINQPPEQDCFLLTARQVGKTTAMSIKAVELCVNKFKKGENILIAALTEKQAFMMLAKALAYAQVKYPRALCKGKDRPTMHHIEFENGTNIFCYAAGQTGEGLRGFTIKKLMIDEGSRMHEQFFVSVVPMLSVVRGSMDIASTPCGKQGYFFECSEDPHFKKYFVPADKCPRHSKEFLEREAARMTKLQFAQEYNAMFLDELKQFFSTELIRKCMTIQQESLLTSFSSPADKFLGVDVARLGDDLSVLVSMERIERKKIKMFDIKILDKTLTTETTRQILELDKKYRYRKIYIDDGGLGVAVFDPLLMHDQTKRKVIAINNASRSLDKDDKHKSRLMKEDLYNNLKRLMEQGQVAIFEDDRIMASMSSIQYEYDERGNMKVHGSDNHVAEALIRAAWCMMDKSLNLW